MSHIIIGLGELLWDEFEHYRRPGGAPANVAYHATRLGSQGICATKVGEDEAGKELTAFLHRKKIPTPHIQTTADYPTGRVTVTMDGSEANYVIHEPAAWDFMDFTEAWKKLATQADAVCFGTLAQRNSHSRTTITTFLAHTRPNALRVYDINLRPPHFSPEIIRNSLSAANVVKLNEHELSDLPKLLQTDKDIMRVLFDEFGIKAICKTKGAKGCEILTPDNHFVEGPISIDTSKGDSVGVGDSFTAALLHNKIKGRGWDESLALANYYAANMAALRGAMAEVPEHVYDHVS